jgi:hypothetical protein
METLTTGQILYYVDWKKHPTIHECKIAKVSENQKEVYISINLDTCKAFSGGSFKDSYNLGRKYFISEKAARDKILEHYQALITESREAHERLVKRFETNIKQTIKPL